MAYNYLFKVVLIGDAGVGKSSILYNITNNQFFHNYNMTIGVEYNSKIVTKDAKYIKLQIWDTAGQEIFRSITKSYYRNNSVIIVVYDTTDYDSFLNVENWLKDIKDFANESLIYLVGNKIDDHHMRKVSFDEGNNFAKKHNLNFIELSAKNCEGKKLFDDIILKLSQKIDSNTYLSGSKYRGIDRINNEQQQSSYKDCCIII